MSSIEFMVSCENQKYIVSSGLRKFEVWVQQCFDAFVMVYGYWYNNLPSAVPQFLKKELTAECMIYAEGCMAYGDDLLYEPKMFAEGVDMAEDKRYDAVYDDLLGLIVECLGDITEDPEYPEEEKNEARRLLKEYEALAEKENLA